MIEILNGWSSNGQNPLNETPFLINIPYTLINIPCATFTLGAYVGSTDLGSRVLGGGGEVRNVRMMGHLHDRLMLCYLVFPLNT